MLRKVPVRITSSSLGSATIRKLIVILSLVVPFLALTPLATSAYFVSLVLLGVDIYQLDLPERITRRGNLLGLRKDSKLVNVTDSLFYTLFYFLTNRFADDVEYAIKVGVVGDDVAAGAGNLLLGFIDLVLMLAIWWIIYQIQCFRIDKSLLDRYAESLGSGLLFFLGVLALGGDWLLELVIIPGFALWRVFSNVQRPSQTLQEVESFEDALLVNWTRVSNPISLFLTEFLLADAFLLVVNLRFLVAELGSLLSPGTFNPGPLLMQMVFLASSGLIPTLGAYRATRRQEIKWRSVIPIVMVYLVSVLILLVYPHSVPFLELLSRTPRFSDQRTFTFASIFIGAMMTGFPTWFLFDVRVKVAYRSNDVRALKKNLTFYIAAILSTVTIGSVPLILESSLITGEPPYLFALLLFLAYVTIYSLARSPYTEQIRADKGENA